MLRTIKYSLLRLLRNKNELFWILLFPIILGIFFKVGFSNINNSEKLSPIPVAVVSENESGFNIFKNIVDEIQNGDNPLFKVTYQSKEKALKLLEDKKIDGILTVSDTIKLTVSANMKENAINQSILDSFVTQYNVSSSAVADIMVSNPDKVPDIINDITKTSSASYNKKVSLTDRENSNSFTQYFYNLLAMACLMTASAGMRISIDNQGNLSMLGARRCISPMHKLKSIIGELIGYVIFNFTCNLIAFIFINVVLKIDLTAHLSFAVLTLFIATLTGISFGFFIGSIGTFNENIKESTCIGIIMFCCFLSGLMLGNMKMLVQQFCPLINKINPAALISDSFYSLSVYNTYDRYLYNIVTLSCLIIIFTLGGFLLTRRKKYASL